MCRMEGYCWLPYGTCKLSLRERLKKNEDMVEFPYIVLHMWTLLHAILSVSVIAVLGLFFTDKS